MASEVGNAREIIQGPRLISVDCTRGNWSQQRDRWKTMLTNATFLKGFASHATNGEIGAVGGFPFDDETWTIRYLGVKTVVFIIFIFERKLL
jgi:hypothetical protein